MRSPSETARACELRVVLWLAAALFAAGCTAPVANQKTRPQRADAVRVDIQQDDFGFTITEEVSVSAEIRADYEAAIRMLEQQRYEQGVEALVRVTQNAPNVTAAHIDLGIAYARTGDLERAEASLKRALEINPRHPIAHNELGMVYRRKGRFAEARASYEKALELFPSFHFARRNLAILCDLYLADLKCAMEQYEAYRLAAPDDEQTAKWLADLQNRVKR